MKYILGLVLAIWMAPLFAQENFSFFTDRRFFDPTDLIGYQFVPYKMEIPKESKATLSAGEVSFGITNKNLYVKGEGIKGVYNINNINSTDYGYILNLLNPRNPASKGHLKVILTKGAYADALVFKKDNNEKEIIFVLPDIDEAFKNKEKAFFTDWGEIKLDYAEDIWGKSIRPFIRITNNPKIQQRLFAKDSVHISFEHIITEIDKSKPAKVNKNTEEVIANSSVQEAEEIAEEVPEIKEEVASTPAPKVEEESNDSPFFSSPTPKEDDESRSSPFFSTPTSKKETIKEEVVEEVIEEAIVMEETPDLVIDPDAVPPIGEEEVREEKIRKGKIKIIETYVITIKSLHQYEDGSSTVKEEKFPVKKWTERADETAKQGEEKFQIEFEGEKGNTCFLYLTTERTISSFEWKNQKLLVRD